MPKKISTEQWIQRFNQLHNTEEYRKEHGYDHYDYSLIEGIENNWYWLNLKIDQQRKKLVRSSNKLSEVLWAQ